MNEIKNDIRKAVGDILIEFLQKDKMSLVDTPAIVFSKVENALNVLELFIKDKEVKNG